jgi:hypothetical protein
LARRFFALGPREDFSFGLPALPEGLGSRPPKYRSAMPEKLV